MKPPLSGFVVLKRMKASTINNNLIPVQLSLSYVKPDRASLVLRSFFLCNFSRSQSLPLVSYSRMNVLLTINLLECPTSCLMLGRLFQYLVFSIPATHSHQDRAVASIVGVVAPPVCGEREFGCHPSELPKPFQVLHGRQWHLQAPTARQVHAVQLS